MAPRRKGSKNVAVGEDVRIAVALSVQQFVSNPEQKELEFPSSLTAVERAYVHELVKEHGLKSKSRGKGLDRFLTVYKRDGSTIVQADANFTLSQTSRQIIYNLLNKYPLLMKEKHDLLPATDRERNLAHDGSNSMYRETKTMGRLNAGIPQVPPVSVNEELLEFRKILPVFQYKNEIIKLIQSNQVIIVCGETGSGKTTQIPQFILDEYSATNKHCRVICTQPRRLSAIAVSERVAAERGEKIGQAIGYQIRLESRVNPKTVLTYCTNGVLLRTLMGGDSSLGIITHIIIDEIHERDKFSDYLLIVLRDSLSKFRNLRLILMSATIDATIFTNYFNGCPVLNIPGRLYSVTDYYLEDVLKMTKYTNSSMKRMEKELKKKNEQQKHLQNWTSGFMSTGAEASSKVMFQKPKGEPILGQHIEPTPERIDLDPEMAAIMDQCLSDCWLSGSADSFGQLFHLILSENISVDYQHSGTGCTGLMLAAGRGKVETVEQLLNLGANISISSSNNWTAYDWAVETNHQECGELIQAYFSSSNLTNLSSVTLEENSRAINADDKHLLDVYSHSFNLDDNVDYDLILSLVLLIHTTKSPGAILIFLPGYDDIVQMREMIKEEEKMNKNKFRIFTLHSNMQTDDHKLVFRKLDGIRKIILSTNIAETAITIDDVVYVIDSGKVKEISFDAVSGTSSLRSVWISKACAKQRAGRAGRTRPGECYHMFSSMRYMESMQEFTTPDILRTPLQELCLHTKLLAPVNTAIADFLAKAVEPPGSMVTRQAVTLLKTMGALDPWEELTELGSHLVDLPIEPKLAKMLLYSVVLKCLDPILTIVCCLAYKDPFVIPTQPSQKRALALIKKQFSADTFSDHMILLRAFQAWQHSTGHERSFCEKNFLSSATLEQIVITRTQLLGQLRASGFVKARGAGDVKDLNLNSENWAVVKAAITASLYPALCRIDREHMTLKTQKDSKVLLHPSSSLRCVRNSMRPSATSAHAETLVHAPSDWMVYEEKSRVGQWCYAKCVTMITPLTVALFAGPIRLPGTALVDCYNPEASSDSDSESETATNKPPKSENELLNSKTSSGDAKSKSVLTIDDWTVFKLDTDVAHYIYQLRQKWNALFIKRMVNPCKVMTQVDESVLRAVVQILTVEEQALGFVQPAGIGQRPRPLTTNSTHSNNEHPSAYRKTPHYHIQSIHKPIPEASCTDAPDFANYNPVHNSAPNPTAMMSTVEKQNGNIYTGEGSASGNYKTGRDFADFGNARFFVLRTSIDSFVGDVWNLSPNNEKRFSKILQNGVRVIFIFCSNNSNTYHGVAEMLETLDSSPQSDSSSKQLFFNINIKIKWITKNAIPFAAARHLANTMSHSRRLCSSKDGQELDAVSGHALATLIIRGRSSSESASVNNGRPIRGQEVYQNMY